MSTKPHPPAFGQASAHVIALSRVLDQLELVEQRIREAEAERLVLLAEAFSIAAQESAPTLERPRSEAAAAMADKTDGKADDGSDQKVFEITTDVVPSGLSGNLAYRSVRAEISMTLNQSEQTTERRMSHAFTLTRNYPNALEQFQEGRLSERHTNVIVDAGAVIGLQDSPEVISRRRGYEGAVLKVAETLTPNRLRPVARKLAEQFAELTIDERHTEACTHRRVYVVGRDDGMADVVAHLPAVEAYSVYDRVAQIAKDVAQAEADVRSEAKAASEAVADDELPRVRTRDEIRADVFADLLLNTGTEGTPTHTSRENGAARSESDGSAEQRSGRPESHTPQPGNPRPGNPQPGNPQPDGSRSGLDQPNLHHRQYRARVQVLVSDSDLFPLTTPSQQGDAQGGGNDNDSGSCSGSESSSGSRSGSRSDSETSFDEDEAYLAQLRAGPPPPVLAGYGPIDRASARRIVGDASHWETIRQREDTGHVLSVDRYRPSEEMRRFLGARDEHCRFPGCRVQLARCDIDHTVDAAKGGPTTTSNLAYLCRGHHTLKHHTGWKVRQEGDGDLRWESPTKRTVVDRPESRVRFVRATDQTDPSDPAYAPMFADTTSADSAFADTVFADTTSADTTSTDTAFADTAFADSAFADAPY